MEVSRVDQRLGFVVGLIPVPLPEAAKAEVGSSVSKVSKTKNADRNRVFNFFKGNSSSFGEIEMRAVKTVRILQNNIELLLPDCGAIHPTDGTPCIHKELDTVPTVHSIFIRAFGKSHANAPVTGIGHVFEMSRRSGPCPHDGFRQALFFQGPLLQAVNIFAHILTVGDGNIFATIRSGVGIDRVGGHFIGSHLRGLHELVAGGQGSDAVFLSERVGAVNDVLFHGVYIGIIGRGCGFWLRYRLVGFCLCWRFTGVGVGNWLEVWYENYAKIKMRPSPYLTYHGYIENHIKPQLGKIPLNDLTTLHLQQFYKKLLAEGRVERIEAQKQPKGLSAKTVRNIHQIISSALKLAAEQRLIAHNPADGCALPKAERKEMQTLPVEQLTSFLRKAKDSGVFALYYIDLTTGLRRGELLGLKWSDIDLEKGDLRVQRQIGRIDGKIIEMPLKTKNAYRTLPLSADAISVLKIQKCKVGNSEWVFPSPTGGPMSPDSVLHMLHRVLKRAGLEHIRFHDLRHTFATLALQNGVDIKTVSGMLGHFSAGFTLDTYAHVTTSAKREAAKTMGNILSGAV